MKLGIVEHQIVKCKLDIQYTIARMTSLIEKVEPEKLLTTA